MLIIFLLTILNIVYAFSKHVIEQKDELAKIQKADFLR